MNSIRLVVTAVGVGVINVICAAAHADADSQAGAPPARSPESMTLTEVVVTANRRQENSQNVPITVEAISADSAGAFGITDMQSLANAIPGLRIDRGTATALPFIRGVGSPIAQVSAEPSVATYVDDVYTPASGASLANFNSISSLEVEKGPQGTLFGRNATGGVIQVFTRNPTPDPALDVSLGYASYDTPSASMYATGKLTEGLSANVSLYGSNQGNGWGHNLTTGDSAFQENRFYGGRAKFLWTPTDTTSLLLSFDHDDTKSGRRGLLPRSFGLLRSRRPHESVLGRQTERRELKGHAGHRLGKAREHFGLPNDRARAIL
jgi:iron complex outermembrane recepter protein